MLRTMIATTALTIMLAPGAFAQAFTPADVDQFAETISELREQDVGSSIKAEMPDMPDPSSMMMGGPIELPELPVDDEGRLAMMREMVEDAPMAEPDMVQAMAIIKSHGYADLTEYATEADYIMAAYLAMNMDDTDLSGMDMSQLNMLPPAMKARIEPSLNWMKDMMAVVNAVPESEVAIVESKADVLEAAMND